MMDIVWRFMMIGPMSREENDSDSHNKPIGSEGHYSESCMAIA